MTEREKAQGFSLKNKSACIIGCGGLGCNIAVHIIGAGIGKLFICDFDTVSESNLNRQYLYTKDDIGKGKCEMAEKRLSELCDNTQLGFVNKKISSEDDLGFAEGCDIIIVAVDNAQARKTVFEFSLSHKIPSVFGAIDGFYGTAYLYIPDVSPCPECAGLISDINAKTNISAAAGIIGSAQAALAVRYLLTEDSDLSGKLLIYDSDRFDTLKIKASAHCFICNQLRI